MDYNVCRQKLDAALKLKGHPVGIKLFKKTEDLDELQVQRPEAPLAFCQLVGQTRYMGKTLGGTLSELDECIFGSAVLGFAEVPNDIADGTRWSRLWGVTEDVARKMVAGMHRFPVGSYCSVVTAPLEEFSVIGVDPDVVLLYGNTAQIWLAVMAYHDITGKRVGSEFSGHGSCEVITVPVEEGRPWVTIPCGGMRGLTVVQDDELIMAVPPDILEKIVSRLEAARIGYPFGNGNSITEEKYSLK